MGCDEKYTVQCFIVARVPALSAYDTSAKQIPQSKSEKCS